MWVDNGAFRPNPGQFPIQVERHLNAFVGAHLPGVTTVTAGARYYTLHGYVAQFAKERHLDEAAAIDLLRRSEVLLAYVTSRHSNHATHSTLTPPGHGIDAILRAATDTEINLATAAAPNAYSRARWGFSGAYRGSELTLKILDTDGFAPGQWYDNHAASSALAALVARAEQQDDVTAAEADTLIDACLCRMADATDGPWLAHLLSGEPNIGASKPTLGALLWQLGRLTTTAMTEHPVHNASELADLIMFDPALREHDTLAGLVAPQRWRGALLRAESVHSWRRIWRNINQLVEGERHVDDLVTAFADSLPTTTTVSGFRADLPAVVDSDGHPQPAERQLNALPEFEQWLARVMLGAERQHHLDTEERIGFHGKDEVRGAIWEELTPAWTGQLLERHDSRTLRDLAREIATTLVHRSQRVALRKSRFDPRKQVFNYPARLHVRDGIAIKVYEETAPAPATRLPQYLSIARQTGLYEADTAGRLSPGRNGDRLA
jgi:hypothetical protein